MANVVTDCLNEVQAVRQKYKGQSDEIRPRYRQLTERMVDDVLRLPPDKRAELRDSLTRDDSALLLGIARSGATSSVEEQNAELLRWGVLALLVEDSRCDARQTLIELTLLDNSARKLGIELSDAYQGNLEFVSDQMKSLVDSYFGEGDRSLAAMGYTESTDKSGRFSYKQSW